MLTLADEPQRKSLAGPTVGAALDTAMACLRDTGVPEPRADAEVLLAHVLGIERAGVIAAARRPFAAAAAARLEGLLARRATREPVAYLTGQREFWSLPIAVDRRVLIPRPETELLVEMACRLAAAARCVLDCGTGSGAVAAALARELPGARVWASDHDLGALAVARANLRRLAPDAGLVCGDWVAPFRAGGLDLIVCNPPYVAEREFVRLAPEVREHEPRQALVAGPDGLDTLRVVVDRAPEALAAGGWLCVEMGAGQAETVAGWVRADARYGRLTVERDIAGIERVLAAEVRGRGTWTRS